MSYNARLFFLLKASMLYKTILKQKMLSCAQHWHSTYYIFSALEKALYTHEILDTYTHANRLIHHATNILNPNFHDNIFHPCKYLSLF